MVRWRAISLGVLTVAAAGAAVGYGLHRRNPTNLLASAEQALERGDRHEAERLAGVLEQRGRPDEAHFVRGKVSLIEAREASRQAGIRSLYDQSELILAAALDFASAMAPAPDWVHLYSLQNPRLLFRGPRAVPGGLAARPHLRQRLDFDNRARTSFIQALGSFNQVREESARYVEAAALAGECLARLGDQRQAVNVLKMVVSHDPDQKDAHRWLAVIYFDTGAMHPALEHLKRVTELDPEDGRPYWQMGHIYKDYRQIGWAIDNYRQALKRKLPPGVKPDVIKKLVELLVDEGRHPEALDALAQCPEPIVREPVFLALKAECLLGLGQTAEAEALAQEALRIDPDLAHGLLLSARILLNTEKPREAIPLLERALKIDAYDEKGRAQIVSAYKRIGNTPKAQEHQRLVDQAFEYKQQMTKLNEDAMGKPWDADLRYQIAALWHKMGKIPEARMWIDSTFTCNPNHKEAGELLKKINAGK